MKDLGRPTPTPKHVQAAKACWLAPFIALILNCTIGKHASEKLGQMAVGILAITIITMGLVFAVWAMIGAVRKGPKHLMFPATFGLIVNGIIVYFIATVFFVAHNAGQQRIAETELRRSGDWIPAGAGWHVNRQALFAIRFPAGWKIAREAESGATIAVSPAESEFDTFYEIISIGRLDPHPLMDEQKFIRNHFEETRTDTVGFKEYRSGIKEVRGSKWSWMEYRQTVNEVEVRVIRYMTIRNGRGYIVFLGSAPESFSKYESILAESILSLRIP